MLELNNKCFVRLPIVNDNDGVIVSHHILSSPPPKPHLLFSSRATSEFANLMLLNAAKINQPRADCIVVVVNPTMLLVRRVKPLIVYCR